ncbi:hypothetical protein AOQ84DRAFT_391481, partial [Glonium stellatum]
MNAAAKRVYSQAQARERGKKKEKKTHHSTLPNQTQPSPKRPLMSPLTPTPQPQ